MVALGAKEKGSQLAAPSALGSTTQVSRPSYLTLLFRKDRLTRRSVSRFSLALAFAFFFAAMTFTSSLSGFSARQSLL
jgi:hypothetical protein